MSMTMVEKIMARAAGIEEVKAGQYVTARVAKAMMYETFAGVLDALERGGLTLEEVWDVDKVVLLFDHYAPVLDVNVETAERHKRMREAAQRLGLKHFYDVKAGISHQVMCERGHVLPGTLVVATDSHTTTYGALNCAGTGIGAVEMAWVLSNGGLWFRVPETIKVILRGSLGEWVMSKDLFLALAGKYGSEFAQYKCMEWAGPGVSSLTLASRMTLACQSVELGAKFSLFPFDSKVADFLAARTSMEYEPVESDPDAIYEAEYDVDLDQIEPLVACPHNVTNVAKASEMSDVKLDQACVGGCANGRLEDLEMVCRILDGKKVHPGIRFLVGPASWEVFREATERGYISKLIESGAIVYHPFCGACSGFIGTLAAGETCITSTSRNFKGRMGSPAASIYLASPATVAASAIRGRITDPREVV